MNWTTLPTLLAVLLWAIPVAQAGPSLTQSLSQQLEREVRHRAELHADADVVVDRLRISNSALAASAMSIKRIELPIGEDGLGRVAAKALLVGPDGRESWAWVQAHVDASVPTVVASRSLDRGQTITRSDVQLTMLPVHRQNLTEPSTSVGQVLKRSIRAGEPVRDSWIARAYAVKRGDIVETTVRRGAILARGSAEVSERGRVGDIIRVKVTSSHRTLRARVLDHQRVEVIR
jgi:flagella basal body P-ring formation protein FlgA